MEKIKSEFKWVDVEEINMPGSYQRAYNRAQVNRLARNFNAELAFPLSCNRRSDGKIYLWDGQHRFHAAKKNGYVKVLCKIDQIGEYEDEAKMFHESQARGIRINLNAMQLFKARVESRDPIAIALENMAKEVGFKIEKNHGKSKVCGAINILETIYVRFGSATTLEALRTLMHAWDEDPNALDGMYIFGLSYFLHEARQAGDEINFSRLEIKLREISPSDVKRIACAGTALVGGRPYRQFAVAFLKIYNKGKKIPLSLKPSTLIDK